MFKSIFKEISGSTSSRRRIIYCCPAPPSLAFARERLSPPHIRSPRAAELGKAPQHASPVSQTFGKCSTALELGTTVPAHSNGFGPRALGRERREGPGWILLPPAAVAFWPKVVKLCLKMVPVGLANLCLICAGTTGGPEVNTL